METTELSVKKTAELSSAIEKVVVAGDLSPLTPEQRVEYYHHVCNSLGLNYYTRPFDYIKLNGKLTLYARKDATDQLRQIHGVSIDDVDIQETQTLFRVKVKGHNREGRSDVEIGVVAKTDMQGNIANIEMKAVTKAKRRFTLSICGLGWIDETEIESIPKTQVQIVDVDDNGVIVEPGQIEAKPVQAEPVRDKAEEEAEFLRGWKHRAGLPPITIEEALSYKTSKGKLFRDCTVTEFSFMLNAYQKRIDNPNNSQEVKDDAAFKMSAINEILTVMASKLAEAEARPDPFVRGNDVQDDL